MNKENSSSEYISKKKILNLILNSWNATMLAFCFSGKMLHNFVPKFHTHSLEKDQLPKELKPIHHT